MRIEPHEADRTSAHSGSNWAQILHDRLQLYGHRNWIVVADSAYPAQAREGIETIVANDDQRMIVEKILTTIRALAHVKPIVYTDQELEFVDERDAPGVTSYRDWLRHSLENVGVLPHEDIISKLDQAGQTFRIFVIKSNMTIPCAS